MLTGPKYANNYAANTDKEFGGRNMPNEAFSLLGRNFVLTVLVLYHSDRLTLRDVSEYLNLKTKHIPGVAQILLSEVAH